MTSQEGRCVCVCVSRGLFVCVCVCVCVCVGDSLCVYVWFFVTPWTITRQAPLSVGFSRQEYWSGLPFLWGFPGGSDVKNPCAKRWFKPLGQEDPCREKKQPTSVFFPVHRVTKSQTRLSTHTHARTHTNVLVLHERSFQPQRSWCICPCDWALPPPCGCSDDL